MLSPVVSRPLLQVGNILNNGYLHCKFLRRRGFPAESLNVDYRHCQGQPEWAEVTITEPVLDWNQDWSLIDLKGFRRPDWFYDVSAEELPRLGNQLSDIENPPDALPASPRSPLNQRMRDVAKTGLEWAGLGRAIVLRRQWLAARALAAHGISAGLVNARAESLGREYRAFYPDAEKPLSSGDVVEMMQRALPHASVFRHYQLIHGFALDPIYAMLATPEKPFIAYEHGTLRDFPFEDSARGRLYRLAVKKAAKVIITNVDVKRSADRLGLNNTVFIPHIIDEDHFSPGPSPLRDRLMAETGCDLIVLHPARHHWKHCPPGMESSWFKSNDILIRGLAKAIAKRPDIKPLILFFEWGQEVKESKRLLAECGLADRVRWYPLQTKPAMRDFYNAADIVADQFHLGVGTFGGIVGEALACGKPVILNYRKELHRWCYPELPPIIDTPDADAVAAELLRLIDDPAARANLGAVGRQWFVRHHSVNLVIGRLLDVYFEIAEREGWDWSAFSAGRASCAG